jgi:hypothetical protein
MGVDNVGPDGIDVDGVRADGLGIDDLGPENVTGDGVGHSADAGPDGPPPTGHDPLAAVLSRVRSLVVLLALVGAFATIVLIQTGSISLVAVGPPIVAAALDVAQWYTMALYLVIVGLGLFGLEVYEKVLKAVEAGKLLGSGSSLNQLGPAAALVGQGVGILSALEVSRVLILGVTFSQGNLPSTQLTFWWVTILALLLVAGCVVALISNTVLIVLNLDSVRG